MSDDLDLRGIDQRHEPDPEFRAALHRRLLAIMEGTDPADATYPADITTIDLEPARRHPEPRRRNRWIPRGAVAVACAAAIVAAIVMVSSRDDGTRPADIPSVSTSVANGWVAFSALDADLDGDVYLVREDSPLAGSPGLIPTEPTRSVPRSRRREPAVVRAGGRVNRRRLSRCCPRHHRRDR